ncbi:MAG: competence/damage-inducible protein A [Zoogloeaceae bacterium]|jgi:molybdopterin-biosynthesis enzyme MoeA-like protein|nr:competence/damage-inducible protein A [Zoogloeaceae bacterium]
MKTFGLVVIGDEILSGKRRDSHFQFVADALDKRGLRLSWVKILGDDRARLAENFRQSLDKGEVVFSCGGIGNTPDDHTRQAVAEALGVGLTLSEEAKACLYQRFVVEMKGELNAARKLLGTFPEGARCLPNPFNRVPGFYLREHYFCPGFPQMAHPMIEWVLDTFYAGEAPAPRVEKAFLLTGDNAHESALLDLMEAIVARWPQVRLFSLPSLNADATRRHLELGVEGAPQDVEAAMAAIRQELKARRITWQWRS